MKEVEKQMVEFWRSEILDPKTGYETKVSYAKMLAEYNNRIRKDVETPRMTWPAVMRKLREQSGNI